MPIEMKRIKVLILSLLCVLLYSCQKSPQDLLVGVWEVSSKTTNSTGSPETTEENPVLYYKFEESGLGKIITLDTLVDPQDDGFTYVGLQDVDDLFFTYVYDKEKNTIVFESWEKKRKTSWIVDKLTDVSFICHSSANGTSTTFNGRKMK